MADSLNVCMIGYGAHPPWNEGCAVVTRNLASALSKNVNVFMIAPIDYFRGFIKGNTDQRLKVAIYVNTNFVFKSLRSRGKYFFLDQLFNAAKVQSIISGLNSRFGIDIVHLFNISHLMVSMLTDIFLGKGTVAHVFGSPGIGDILAENFIDAYACTSHLNCSNLINQGVPIGKVHVIPPIINCDLYKPLAQRSVHGESSTNGNFILTYMGNIGSKRLPPDLITQMKELAKARPRLELDIYCPDISLNRENAILLETILSKFEIKHRIVVSNLKEVEKVRIYNRSNALIFPYSSDAVIIDPPLAMLEGMACGKIVIASRILSTPDVVEHGENGFLVDAGDYKGFKDAITHVMDNSGELQHVGENARETIQDIFSPDIVTTKIMNVYRSIIN